MSSNETEFKVGERIYFRLINGNASEKVFWRFEHQYFIQGGVKFDTWDPKLNRDLEPLEQSSIDTGGFRIDAFSKGH